MPDPALRAALAEGDLILAPGVFDMISAKIADRMGFQALYVTGFGLAASHLGLPDAGLASYGEVVDRIARIADGTITPIIADGDTGFGGLLNVRHSVRGYEAAGASAIQIEDQEFPKKCGHTDGRRVIPAEDMARKIAVALEARRSEDFLIIARTDARTTLGLDEALRRAALYAATGADLIFVESPESEAELAAIAQAIDAPLVANMATGGKTPILPADRLAQMGYALAIHPAVGFLGMGAALSRAYAELRDEGHATRAPMHDFDDFCRLMGFEEVWEFERRWVEPGGRASIASEGDRSEGDHGV
ncbi:MAG: isocitrate lyase/PEP mutase family protein [Pseudomonadota bacterium]